MPMVTKAAGPGGLAHPARQGLSAGAHAIRCDHDGLKMAEVVGGCLVLRTRHHGEVHVKVVPLRELAE